LSDEDGLVGMGMRVTGTPSAVRGEEGEGEEGNKMGERVAISVVLETKRTYTSAEWSFVNL